MNKVQLYYATKSRFKRDELAVLRDTCEFVDAAGNRRKVGELIDFRLSDVETEEPLKIDLEEMVRHKARSAYRRILAPCIVEHAGLIFDSCAADGFPGGLTQPMWDALGPEEFLRRTASAGTRASARAVIGLCDGMSTRTFVGETNGVLSEVPRGAREFYWDVVFCPDDGGGQTYAEMAAKGHAGMIQKMALSQSSKAMVALAEFLSRQNGPSLFYS